MTSVTVDFEGAGAQTRSAGRAAEHLRGGGWLIHPTETVYGIGCALEPGALAGLSRAKRQGREAPFLLLIPDAWMSPALVWTDTARRLADAFWPGPLTLALNARAGSFPTEVTSPEGTVAVRRSAHAGVRAIVNELGAPMTSTSANRPGEPAASTAAEATSAAVALEGTAPLLTLDGGALEPALPSTLVHAGARVVHVIRHGAIPLDALRRVLGDAHVE